MCDQDSMSAAHDVRPGSAGQNCDPLTPQGVPASVASVEAARLTTSAATDPPCLESTYQDAESREEILALQRRVMLDAEWGAGGKELGEEPYRRMMGFGEESWAQKGNDWDEDAAPICDGGLGLPKGGPIRYASEPGVVGEGGLSWIGQAPVVGKEIGGTGCERRWGGKAVLVATGYTHTVIVSDDECVYACGLNEHGQLGVGDLRDRHLPTELPFFRSVASAGGGVAQVACGGDHTVVLLRNGSLYGFGKNQNGQLGLPNLGTDAETDFPWPMMLMQIPGEDGLDNLGLVKSVACGLDCTYATMSDGQVRVMGGGKYGQTGMGNHGNCAAPQEIVGLQGPELQVAAGMYHALAVGCVNLVRNKLRKIESTYSLAWQQSAQLMRQEAEFREGKAPPLPNWSPELLSLVGHPGGWPLDLNPHNLQAPPIDVGSGGGHGLDGFAGNRPYDAYAALPDDGDESVESEEGVTKVYDGDARDEGLTRADDCEWAQIVGASRIQRVRWLHGGVLEPTQLQHTRLREDDSFSDHLAKYEDSEDQRYAQALVTDFNDNPLRPPWWLKGNEMYGDDENDRTTFQSVIDADDYLDQPEHLKP